MLKRRFSQLFVVCFVITLIMMLVTFLKRGNWMDVQDQSTYLDDYFNAMYPGYRNCLPNQKVAFMKTHKCASTTIQNILMRYGIKHELNFVLPLNGHYLGKMIPFDRSMLKGTPWHEAHLPYHIFAQHTRWNYNEVKLVLGNQSAAFISIVRDPVEQFISLWEYGHLGNFMGISLEEYALMINKVGNFEDRKFTGNLGRNQMLWDFGLSPSEMENQSVIEQKIAKLDSEFDLVMVAEHFDESIILLRDLLCWEFRDVTSFKLNARHPSNSKDALTSQAKGALKSWLWADYLLYNHFLSKFHTKVKQYGRSRMDKELAILRSANMNMFNSCVQAVVSSQNLPEPQQLWGENLLGYKLKKTNDSSCHKMVVSEVRFVQTLKELQAERALKVLGDSGAQVKPRMLTMPFRMRGIGDIEEMKRFYKSKNVP